MTEMAAPRLKALLDSGADDELRFVCQALHPADIAGLTEGFTAKECLDLVEKLDRPEAIEVFEFLAIERQEEMVEGLNRKRMAPLINEMSPDDRADLAARLPDEVLDSLLPLLAAAERQDIKKLLTYKESSAGSIMTTDYAAVPRDITVGEALQRLRREAPDAETIYDVYVLDDERRLVGVVTLRDLILVRPSDPIEKITRTHVISAHVDDDREDVADKIRHYDFLALPVLDAGDRLVGIVTVDDAMDVVDEEMTEDMYAIGAAGKPPETDYLATGVFTMARKRVVWLMLLVFTGLASGAVLEYFQGMLHEVVALIFFVPLLCGSAGNAGSQASTVVIRALATGDVHLRDILRVLRKEICVGLIVGVALGILAGLRASLIHVPDGAVSQLLFHVRLGLTVGLAMLCVVVLAKGLGASLPILFKSIGLDPALMSGPFITSVLDVFGLFVYLNLARLILIPVLTT